MARDRKICCVSDDTNVARVFGDALRKSSVQTCHFLDMSQCLTELENGQCDLLVVDLGGEHGATCTQLALPRLPYFPPKILAIVAHADVTGAVRAMKEGSLDCIEKPLDRYTLRSKVEGLLDGQGRSSDLDCAHLTAMETLILKSVLEGRTTRQIARDLHRSPRTVEVHRKNIMRKLGVSNVVGLVRQALEMGLFHV